MLPEQAAAAAPLARRGPDGQLAGRRLRPARQRPGDRYMARFSYEFLHSDKTLRLLLRGTFDGSSAWEIRHAIEGVDADEVILDFDGIVETWEFGAAILSAGLRGLDRGRIRLINLPAEVREALGFFGVPVEDPGGNRPAEAAL
jgi:hypothetical protein